MAAMIRSCQPATPQKPTVHDLSYLSSCYFTPSLVILSVLKHVISIPICLKLAQQALFIYRQTFLQQRPNAPSSTPSSQSTSQGQNAGRIRTVSPDRL